jgi:hypothetical protein
MIKDDAQMNFKRHLRQLKQKLKYHQNVFFLVFVFIFVQIVHKTGNLTSYFSTIQLNRLAGLFQNTI